MQFLGYVDDETRRRHLSQCRALVFPGEEDFGLVPVEAQASGRPVIAYAAGGALDTVVEGETGLFFSEQRVEAVCETIERFAAMAFHAERITAHAAAFDTSVFKKKMTTLIDSAASRPRLPKGSRSPPSLA